MFTKYTTSLILPVLALAVWSFDINAKERLILGVHPFKKPHKIYKMFKPLVDDLSRRLGKEVTLVIGKSYTDIIQQHQTGEIDFGYFGPASYVTARSKTRLIPLARIVNHGKGAFRGVIVVRQDSPLKQVKQLKGKRFAFGDPESTLSHYVPHYMLNKVGIKLTDLKKYAFTGNHDNVALNVLQGNFDAGGLKPDVAKQYLNQGLRILAHSQWIPEHLFAANGKLSNADRNSLRKVLLSTNIKYLKPIKSSITGLESAKTGDYDELKIIIDSVSLDSPSDNAPSSLHQ